MFHRDLKVLMATKPRAGRDCGKTTLRRVDKYPQPSNLAASSSSCGRLAMNCLIRKMLKPAPKKVGKKHKITKEERERLGKNGKDYVVKNHTYEILNKKLLQLFMS